MKNYKFTIGTGFYQPFQKTIEIEDYMGAQDALDILIDNLEKEGCESFFGTQKEIDDGELFDDEYTIGGNHCRILKHYGTFIIEEVNKWNFAQAVVK